MSPRVEYVGSADDIRVADYFRLTDVALRKKLETERGLYMAESAEVIGRALGAGHTVRSVLMTRSWWDRTEQGDGPIAPLLTRIEATSPDTVVYVGDDPTVTSVTGFHVHRGVLAAMNRPLLPPAPDIIAGASRIAILEDIVDHTNVGAIFRGTAGLGVDAVLVSPRCADPLYRRSVRVSMGTVFQVPWTRLDSWPHDLDLVRDAGFAVAALALRDDAISLDRLAANPPAKLALMLGTEGTGLSAHALDLADTVVRIPMAGGVDSLNVAAAAAVAFWATRPGSREGGGV